MISRIGGTLDFVPWGPQQLAAAVGAGAGAHVTSEGLAVCKQLGLSTAEWLTAGAAKA